MIQSWDELPSCVIDEGVLEELDIIDYLNIEGCRDDGINLSVRAYRFPCGLTVACELAYEKSYKGVGRLLYDSHRRHHYHSGNGWGYPLDGKPFTPLMKCQIWTLVTQVIYGEVTEVKVGCECEYAKR